MIKYSSKWRVIKAAIRSSTVFSSLARSVFSFYFKYNFPLHQKSIHRVKARYAELQVKNPDHSKTHLSLPKMQNQEAAISAFCFCPLSLKDWETRVFKTRRNSSFCNCISLSSERGKRGAQGRKKPTAANHRKADQHALVLCAWKFERWKFV